jgi:ATP-dependent DNA helicase RecG
MTENRDVRVFISSVQKELEHERAAVAQLISTDPFLLKHCEAVLYDKEPSSGRPSEKGYLECLKSCQIYLLLVDIEYGRPAGDFSATHEEYQLAQKVNLPSLIFIRGLDKKHDAAREKKTKEFIDETKRDGYKYVRFHDREDLKPSVRAALYSVLKAEFKIRASAGESEEGKHLIEVASSFESTPLPDVSRESLDQNALADLVEVAIGQPGLRIWDDSAEHALVARGLASLRPGERAIITRGAFLLFASRPANRFPQCEILADAYEEPKISGRPKGQLTINAPLLGAVEQALKFVDDHTFHPRRVVGLNNMRLDEYPARALRETLINAVAHRTYDDATRKILLRVFSDRVEIASPGYPPKPLTLAKLRSGAYRPCSRNPLMTQTLALLNQMEQRGTGMARMRDAMLDHGLDVPVLSEDDGYFVVTLHGPAGDYDRIRTPSQSSGPITPAIEARLNERQKAIMLHVQQEGSATNRWVQEKCRVVRDTAHRDLQELVVLELLKRVGKGRTTRYELAPLDV